MALPPGARGPLTAESRGGDSGLAEGPSKGSAALRSAGSLSSQPLAVLSSGPVWGCLRWPLILETAGLGRCQYACYLGHCEAGRIVTGSLQAVVVATGLYSPKADLETSRKSPGSMGQQWGAGGEPQFSASAEPSIVLWVSVQTLI